MDEKDILSRFLAEDDTDDILTHYGKEGMHWGERRYQYEDGSLTPLGRIHYGIGKRREKKEAARVKKVEKLARSGDVDKILKNRKLFTREEMQDALTRAQNMERAKATGKSAQRKAEKEKKEREKGQQKQPTTKQDIQKSKITVEGVLKTAGTVLTIYKTYNDIAKAVNQVTGEDTLPQFDSPKSGKTFRDWKNSKNPTYFDTSKAYDYSKTGKTWEYSSGIFDKEDTKGMRTYKSDTTKTGIDPEVVGTGTSSKTSRSSSRSNKETVNMFFNAATGAYAAGTGNKGAIDWYDAMDYPLSKLR